MLFRLCYCGDLDSVHVFTDQSGGNVTNTETQDFTKRPFKAFLHSVNVFLDITFLQLFPVDRNWDSVYTIT